MEQHKNLQSWVATRPIPSPWSQLSSGVTLIRSQHPCSNSCPKSTRNTSSVSKPTTICFNGLSITLRYFGRRSGTLLESWRARTGTRYASRDIKFIPLLRVFGKWGEWELSCNEDTAVGHEESWEGSACVFFSFDSSHTAFYSAGGCHVRCPSCSVQDREILRLP